MSHQGPSSTQNGTNQPDFQPELEEIHLSPDKKQLTLRFADGRALALDAEYLRVESPSAEVRGHHPSERKIIGNKRHVSIKAIEPVGHYAIRLVFDDGHNTGLYTWAFLIDLAERHGEIWKNYLDSLAAQGLSR
jgi:DUF971 family protein